MRRVNVLSAAVALLLAGTSSAAFAQVTAFEGARIIVGNGQVIENGTIVVTTAIATANRPNSGGCNTRLAIA